MKQADFIRRMIFSTVVVFSLCAPMKNVVSAGEHRHSGEHLFYAGEDKGMEFSSYTAAQDALNDMLRHMPGKRRNQKVVSSYLLEKD